MTSPTGTSSTTTGRRTVSLREGDGRAPDERGATVLEWALIAAVVVVATSIIAALIFRIIDGRGAGPEQCADQPSAAECTP